MRFSMSYSLFNMRNSVVLLFNDILSHSYVPACFNLNEKEKIVFLWHLAQFVLLILYANHYQNILGVHAISIVCRKKNLSFFSVCFVSFSVDVDAVSATSSVLFFSFFTQMFFSSFDAFFYLHFYGWSCSLL